MVVVEGFWGDPACARDTVWRQVDVQIGSQVDDHQGIATGEPWLEFCRRDASLSEVKEEPAALHVLEYDVRTQGQRDGDGERPARAGQLGHHETNEPRADIAEDDPDAGPQQGA